MRRFLTLSVVLLVSIALAAENITVSAILKDPSRFDNKAITVVGKVAKFKARTSRAGNKYFTFDLTEGTSHIPVYGKGELKPEPKDGDKVEATGLFAKERKLGSSTFKNELDVTKKEKEKFGVKVVK
jgi:hypothetical protein